MPTGAVAHVVLKNAAQKKRAGARAGEREENAFHRVTKCLWRHTRLRHLLSLVRTWLCDGDRRLRIHSGSAQSPDAGADMRRMTRNRSSRRTLWRDE